MVSVRRHESVLSDRHRRGQKLAELEGKRDDVSKINHLISTMFNVPAIRYCSARRLVLSRSICRQRCHWTALPPVTGRDFEGLHPDERVEREAATRRSFFAMTEAPFIRRGSNCKHLRPPSNARPVALRSMRRVPYVNTRQIVPFPSSENNSEPSLA